MFIYEYYPAISNDVEGITHVPGYHATVTPLWHGLTRNR